MPGSPAATAHVRAIINCSINATKHASNLAVAMDGIIAYEGIYMKLPRKETPCILSLSDKQETRARCIKSVDEPN